MRPLRQPSPFNGFELTKDDRLNASGLLAVLAHYVALHSLHSGSSADFQTALDGTPIVKTGCERAAALGCCWRHLPPALLPTHPHCSTFAALAIAWSCCAAQQQMAHLCGFPAGGAGNSGPSSSCTAAQRAAHIICHR